MRHAPLVSPDAARSPISLHPAGGTGSDRRLRKADPGQCRPGARRRNRSQDRPLRQRGGAAGSRSTDHHGRAGAPAHPGVLRGARQRGSAAQRHPRRRRALGNLSRRTRLYLPPAVKCQVVKRRAGHGRRFLPELPAHAHAGARRPLLVHAVARGWRRGIQQRPAD